jgi:hypothetical protein
VNDLYKATGTLKGTTYSGHPTCTTNMGTMRNFLFHFSAIWNHPQFSFSDQVADLPTKPYYYSDGSSADMPGFFPFVELVRKNLRLMFAGDDTGAMAVLEHDTQTLEIAMRRYCHNRQELATHGLGLVLKSPKRDYKRVNILSRHIAIFKGKPIVVRKLENTLLTNATCSVKLNDD